MDALKLLDAGLEVPEICRELGSALLLSTSGALNTAAWISSMMAHMKELKSENARLKKMYIEDKLKVEILNEATRKKC